ncbi:hypothetical protein [Fodinibius halophilus]|uniref:Lipoprotein n=1 Tax=Fodinibius halophilus TaxID=1736908 RepID=A0A6M1T7K7_9BACT|nr:hypothetical protein [Fodinibius halophilus]NGP90227.1 hypothetical protein [Fodinibius halophilus]
MSAKLLYIIFPFLLFSCTTQKGDFENYEVYVWRAFYNPADISTGDYEIKIESDTLINGSPIQIDSTDGRFLLYRNLNFTNDSTWHKRIVKINNDSLAIYSNMLETIWYDEEYGILKFIIPHSRRYGKIRSYELVKQIEVANGIENERNFDSTVSAINEIREKEREKFIEGLKQQN